MTQISFFVPGTPQGKQRHRVTVIGGKARQYTPGKTAAYEGLVAHAAAQAMTGMALITGPVEVSELRIRITPPESWSQKKKREALAGAIVPTKVPDVDNVEKAIFDGMNGVVWHDDKQVVDVLNKTKRYGEVPGVWVTVRTLDLVGA